MWDIDRNPWLMGNRGAIYLRQSIDRDGNMLAVDRQRTGCLALVEKRGIDVVATLVDNDTSATSRKPRPRYLQLLALIEAREIDFVVTPHIDRLLRKLSEMEHLITLCEAAHVKVLTVSGDLDLSTDAGRLVGRILASVARGEVERMGRRRRDAHTQAAQRGEWKSGRRPFGYDKDGVTVRLDEAKAVRDGYAALLAGASLREIARDWNSRGLTTGQTRRGEHRGEPSAWRADSVRYVLLNPRYAGLRAHHKEVVGPALWPALVPEETWRAAGTLLRDPARSRPIRHGVALLTGVAICGVCGGPVHGGRGNAKYRVYRCRDSTGHVARRAEPVEEYVTDMVVGRLSRPDAVDLLIDTDRPDVDQLRAEALALRGRLDEIAAAFGDGELTRAQARVATEHARAALAKVEEKMADAGRLDVLGPLVRATDTAAVWQSLSRSRRSAAIAAVATVRLMPPGRGTRTFRPESVSIEWVGR